MQSTTGAVLLAPSPAGEKTYDFMYYIKGAAAGGICCSVTHGALTPVDVVKTRVQLDPIKVGRSHVLIYLLLHLADKAPVNFPISSLNKFLF